MSEKLKIYLCDLVHDYLGSGTFVFPLNLGFLTAYLNKFYKDEIDVSLFKYPKHFLEALNSDLPDITGFGNYTWNADLNRKMSELVKEKKRDMITIFGGPNLDYNDVGIERFFTKTPNADFYIPFQGELPLKMLVGKILRTRSLKDLKQEPIDGVIFNDDSKGSVVGKRLERLKNPDEVPSPYLTGLMDQFFDMKLIPIVETNRGCPYTCTFCAQGLASHNKIEFFPIERVKEEADYIAQRVKHTNLFEYADSNFGIHPRDVDIAKYMKEVKKKYGYPQRVAMNWAKNQPKILEITKILEDDIYLIISMQSLDTDVLKEVKRSNIKNETFDAIIEEVNLAGGVSGSEVILGLPGETKESHMKTLRQLFDRNVSYIMTYNLIVLEGTEMSGQREKYDIKSKFRLSDGAFGKYEGRYAYDYEEGVMSTNKMTNEELLSFRLVHFLIWSMWNHRLYFDYLKLFQLKNVNPLDLINRVIDNLKISEGRVRNFYDNFVKDTYDEWHDTPEKLAEFYSTEENFTRLREGTLAGKINGKYQWRLMLEYNNGLKDVVLKTGEKISDELELGITSEQQSELLDFSCSSLLDYNVEPDKLGEEKTLTFHYDFLSWKKERYTKKLDEYYNKDGFTYKFSLEPERRENIKKFIHQYSHSNKLVVYRKMSEYLKVSDLFYCVKLA